MGCNCKAAERVRSVQNFFEYESENKKNLQFKTIFKKFFKTILVFLMLIIALPFIVFYTIGCHILFKKKIFKISNLIKIKI